MIQASNKSSSSELPSPFPSSSLANMSNLYLVVIAGGSGTRFWPKSTAKKPKQLLAFGGDTSKTLLAKTLARFDNFIKPERRMIVTTNLLKDPVAREAPNVKILAEPQGRNTAPCIYWAARTIASEDPEAVMAVMPSDHSISLEGAFQSTVQAAAKWAFTHDDLVTLGIKPVRAETGYGYLRVGDSISSVDNQTCRKVEAFVEKPNLQKAEQFLKSGNYLWNGGMFLWRVRAILRAFDKFMPEMREAWESSEGKVELAYPLMTATSIDYAVMEKADNVVTFSLDCGWDDLGSWTSLEGLADLLGARQGDNVVTGGDILSIESHGNIVDTGDKLVALLGVNNLVIVETGSAILIADKNRAQDIKLVVDKLKTLRPDLL